jgi:hypothetical protein
MKDASTRRDQQQKKDKNLENKRGMKHFNTKRNNTTISPNQEEETMYQRCHNKSTQHQILKDAAIS